MTSTMATTLEQARQIRRSGSFDLECDADTAFPLFSPEGEREWINDWNPRPVFPDSISFKRDTVFRQDNERNETLWTIVDVDWEAHRVEYVRFAPASHSAHIIVEVELTPSRCSRVTVSYTVTAFGKDQGRLLEAFSEPAYAAKMRDWQRRISERLANQKSPA